MKKSMPDKHGTFVIASDFSASLVCLKLPSNDRPHLYLSIIIANIKI